jgi:hypothetical protein
MSPLALRSICVTAVLSRVMASFSDPFDVSNGSSSEILVARKKGA